MNFEQIMDTIKDLAHSQGFYDRLYNNIRCLESADPEAYERLKAELESRNFKNPVDLILAIEG